MPHIKAGLIFSRYVLEKWHGLLGTLTQAQNKGHVPLPGGSSFLRAKQASN